MTGVQTCALPISLRHQKTRYNLKAVQSLIDSCYHKREALGFDTPDYKNKKTDKDFQVKFVVSEYMDIEEIKNDFVDRLDRKSVV